MPPAALNLKPHMDVMQWLAALDLKQYSSNFEKFDGVEVRKISWHKFFTLIFFVTSTHAYLPRTH